MPKESDRISAPPPYSEAGPGTQTPEDATKSEQGCVCVICTIL